MNEIVTGGKAVNGAAIGILMLRTRFPRVLGDGGNAATWPFPLLYKVVDQATPRRVVTEGGHGLLDAFIQAARELVDLGADGITTNCGFLAIYQAELARACAVPVATSSLMQVPMVQALLPPGRRVGILTIAAESLTAAHLEAAGAPPDTPVQGTENGQAFSPAILGDQLELDVTGSRADILEAGRILRARHPEVGAVVLECTNMSPYAADLARATGLPVYDFFTFVTWFHAGLSGIRPW